MSAPVNPVHTEMCSCSSNAVVRIHSRGTYCGDDQHERVASAIHGAYETAAGWPGEPASNTEDWGDEASAVLDVLRGEPAPAATVERLPEGGM